MWAAVVRVVAVVASAELMSAFQQLFFFSSSSVRKNKTRAMDTSMMTASFSLFLHAEDEARTYCTAMSSMSDDKQDDKLRLLTERVQNG